MTIMPLTVLACGMSTAVGLTAPASCAAIRARLNGFKETRFMALDGEWLIGAEIPFEEPWRGVPRIAHLLEGPLRECLAATDLPPEKIPFFLCTAELDRPGRFEGLDTELLVQTQALLDATFDSRSRILPMGRVGASVGIRAASRLINEQGVRHVIVGGADTFLVAETLRSFDENARLLTTDNSNGFIPGEAAAALLLGGAFAGPGLAIRSLGLASEATTIGSEEPLRADGLTNAFRFALDAAGLEMQEIGYRISTMSGEQYWFKEFDLATSRLLRGRHEFMDLWHPADSIGETGAAALPCCLAVAWMAAYKGYEAGNPVLVTASNDDGRRTALILSSAGEA
jgi:3-oxoacyl-[acyl-carrier-protein] synthase-1